MKTPSVISGNGVINKVSLLLITLLLIQCKSDDKKNTPAPAKNECADANIESWTFFTPDNPWNLDISNAPVDENSDLIINNIGDVGLKADFGSGLYEGVPIGIPYVTVCGNQAKVEIFHRGNSYDGNYESESDLGPFPIPLNAPIEGNGVEGDKHVIAVDVENKILYELYNATRGTNRWEASTSAMFDLKTNYFRTDGWTSADAAGLPIFPGLVRYDEVASGVIDHPIRFTLQTSKIYQGYVHPARHKITGGASGKNPNQAPFGIRMRLKSSVDISQFSASNQVILTAMKKYGIILADIGSSLFISGAPDERWNNEDLLELGQIRASDFEVIEMGTIKE